MVEKDNTAEFGESSKFTRILLVIATVFLVFVGPTYVPYLLLDVLKINYFVSMAFGFVLFIIGLVLVWFLVRKKIFV